MKLIKNYVLIPLPLLLLTTMLLLSCVSNQSEPTEAQKQAFSIALKEKSPIITAQIANVFKAAKPKPKKSGRAKLLLTVDAEGNILHIEATGKDEILNQFATQVASQASPLPIPNNMPYKTYKLQVPVRFFACNPTCKERQTKTTQTNR